MYRLKRWNTQNCRNRERQNAEREENVKEKLKTKTMLTYIDKKPAAGTLDRKVKYLVQSICLMWPTIEDFERLFTLKLSEMPRMNSVSPKFAYKLIRDSSTVIEVWHVDQAEMIHDRLLCAVEYISDIEIDLAMME